MGLLDFVKSAGAKLTGKKEDPTQTEEHQELLKGVSLMHHVVALGLEVERLNVSFDDGVATITGTCPTQAEKEKIILAVGNVEGVGQVDDRMVVEAPEPEAQFHTVVSGDTLSKIARNFYGDAMKYPVIFEANKPMLTDPDKIYPGQVLRIPPLEE
jgi:nucleoid-associated protein YgaU